MSYSQKLLACASALRTVLPDPERQGRVLTAVEKTEHDTRLDPPLQGIQRAVHALGSYTPCTARLSNRIHSFFVETGPRAENAAAEKGIEVKLVTPNELAALILSGEFTSQLHVGALLLAALRGHLDIAAFG